MELYLMRHADAVAQSEWDRDDTSRPLSDLGRERLKTALPDIKKSGFLPALVLSSPFVRAKETADIICSLDSGLKPLFKPALSAGNSISTLRSELMANKNLSSLLIIGHMPDLAHFASALVGDPWLLDEGHMEPAAIWAIDPGNFEKSWGTGSFIWRRNLSDWKTIG